MTDRGGKARARLWVPMIAAMVVVVTGLWAPVAYAESAPEPSESSIPAPSRAGGATVARLVTSIRARARLDRPSPSTPVSAQTSWSGEPTSLLVLEAAISAGREWVKVLLPNRPDGSTGWVPRDQVILTRTAYWVEVSTGRRTVTVYRSGHLARRFRAVVGKASTPTPQGLAAIYERDRQPDPRAFVGTWVLALTAESEVLRHFEGGTGRIGIHGRAGASLLDPLGSARSHGCIRISNGPVSWMAAHVPVGTPVEISD